VKFTGSDLQGRRLDFSVQFRELSRRAGAGASGWKTIPRSRFAGSNKLTFHGTRGRTYQFRVRSVNSTGTTSRPALCRTVVPLDDQSPAIKYSGPWGSVSQGRAFKRHFKVADDRQASLRATFVGGDVKLIGPTGPAGGKALVKVGKKSKVVSFYSARGHDRVVLFSANLSVGHHVLEMHPVRRKSTAARGYKVAVDALAVANARR
jgi:hypothetical protein